MEIPEEVTSHVLNFEHHAVEYAISNATGVCEASRLARDTAHNDLKAAMRSSC